MQKLPDYRPDRLIGYARAALGEGDYVVDQFGQPHVLADGVAYSLPHGAYSWLRNLMWDNERRGVPGEALQTAAGRLTWRIHGPAAARTGHRRCSLGSLNAWSSSASKFTAKMASASVTPGKIIIQGAISM